MQQPAQNMWSNISLWGNAGPHENGGRSRCGRDQDNPRMLFQLQMTSSILAREQILGLEKGSGKTNRNGSSTAKELECLVGRMTHLSVIVPFVYHFQGRIRDLQSRAKTRRKIKINSRCLDDVRLMSFFLEKPTEGSTWTLYHISYPHFVIAVIHAPKASEVTFTKDWLEMVPTGWTTLLSIKYPPGALGCNNYTIDWPLLEKGRLHLVYDRQHQIRRVVQRNKLQWAWRRPDGSNNQNRSSPETRNEPPRRRSERLQPKVPWYWEPGGKRTLLGWQ